MHVPSDSPHSADEGALHILVTGYGVMHSLMSHTWVTSTVTTRRMRCIVAGETDGKEVRGFGKGYEEYPEELLTPVNSAKLIGHLKVAGYEHVVPSLDVGRYLCHFIDYCSLAESRRTAATGGKTFWLYSSISLEWTTSALMKLRQC
ncbi:uncharacterized protein LAESUDRAFT_718538 [Laetiporus sulphureus 93-53]|uniref:Uncharacterized protein n=1 Tax=Laetiporus sulphureus 93-53 TaxID=1314785 RepID=A0A165AUR6_9APHY|nr:uncharacterized protein LAESUDRAFT_718538 [Laetiporus sulphureus 93-53]KZS99700.1 hypothetical protein LAESUDRAFT_718538 [Laetiporus sulphureus 93-53]